MGTRLKKKTSLTTAIARTNIALYKQLHAAGWDTARLVEARNCYEFATTLFAGHCRASGKPFLAHLVGTASILAAFGAEPTTVAAGLLHAAYDQGDFGITRWRNRRARVRRAIGDASEALVWQYHQLSWDGLVARIQDGLDKLTTIEPAIVLMRLANELDDISIWRCATATPRRTSIENTAIALSRWRGRCTSPSWRARSKQHIARRTTVHGRISSP
jgi:hypothetical protein